MKATAITFLTICALIVTGCTTPVAIDPMSGQEQNALYRTGYFYGPLEAPIGKIFKTAIRELDDMGYFRTGERHEEDSITIFARKVGDERVNVRISKTTSVDAAAQSEIRIRVGKLGNLAESQAIYARIRNAL